MFLHTVSHLYHVFKWYADFNHNIKVTVAKDGTVTATSAKYVVTSDKNATNIVVKDAAGKVIASATAKDGKYTVKLPADKAKDLTITQYVAK